MRLSAVALVLLALVLPGRAGAWSWPVDGPVLRPFSFDPAHPYASGQHRGVDLGAPTGAPVAAPAAGVVSFAGDVPTNGLSVTIRTADGYSATLVHLGSIAVHAGESVAEGALAGTIGPSGTPELDVPYVHVGIRRTDDPNGYLDPLSFFPARAEAVPAPPPTLGGGDPLPEPAPAAPATTESPPAATPRRQRSRRRRPASSRRRPRRMHPPGPRALRPRRRPQTHRRRRPRSSSLRRTALRRP